MARYWVGGTGSWDQTTHWSTTSGGSSGASVPTSSDDVYFDANSGTGTMTLSSSAVQYCKSLNCTGYTGTFAFYASDVSFLVISGSLTLSSGMTLTVGIATDCGFIFSGSAGGNITTAGKMMPSIRIGDDERSITATGTWSLQDNVTLEYDYYKFVVYGGTLTTNNYNITVDTVTDYTYWGGTEISFGTEGTNAKTLNLGSSTITVGAFTMERGAVTLNAGTSTIVAAYFYDYRTTATPITIYDLQDNVYYGYLYMECVATLTCHDLTLNSSILSEVIIENDVVVQNDLEISFMDHTTISYWPTFNMEGYTLTANNIIDIDECVMLNTNLDGNGAPYDVSLKTVYDGGQNSGFTFGKPGTNRYWVGNGGTWNWTSTTHWSAASGGSTGASVPTPHDNVYFDANSFSSASQTVTMTMQPFMRDFDVSGVTNSPVISGGIIRPQGDIYLSSSISLPSGTTYINLYPSPIGDKNIYFNGYSPAKYLYISAWGGGILHFKDDVTSISYLETNGNVDFEDSSLQFSRINVYAGTLNLNASLVTLTMAESNNYAIRISSGTTIAGTSNVTLSDTGANTINVYGGNYNELEIESRTGVVKLNSWTGAQLAIEKLILNYDGGGIDFDGSKPIKVNELEVLGGSRSNNNLDLVGDGSSVVTTDNDNLVFKYVSMSNMHADRLSSYEYTASSMTFSWDTLTGSATTVTLSDDDYAGITLPFDATYFDLTNVTQVSVGSNGYLEMQQGTGVVYGDPFPALKNAIFGVWEDLDPSSGGTVKYETFGTTPNRKFVLEFNDVPNFGGTGDTSFQIKLFENSTDIEIHTLEVDNSNSDVFYQGIEFNREYYAYGTRASTGFGSLTNDAVKFTRSLKDSASTIKTYYAGDSQDLGGNTAWQFGLLASQDTQPSVTTTLYGANVTMHIVQDAMFTNQSTFYGGVADLYIRTLSQSSRFDNSNTFYAGVIGADENIIIPASYSFSEPENLNSTNLKSLKIGHKFGPVTTVVLGRQPQNDNILIASLSPESNLITDISTSTNLFTVSGHGLLDGNLVRVHSDGTYPSPLQPETNYYVYTNGSTDTFALTPSYEKAIAGNNIIDITTTGSGTITLTHIESQELQINNNQIMDDDRQTLLPTLYAELVGKEWNEVEAETVGLGWHEIGDVVEFTQGTTTVLGYIGDIKLHLEGSVKETLVSRIPEITNTDYQSAGGIIKTIYNTEIKVDKQENDITSIVSQQDVYATEVQENFTQLYQDLENIALTIQKSGGGNLIDNSVGFATEAATDNSSQSYDKLSLWDYNTNYDMATHGTVLSYSSSVSQNAGGVSGQVVEMAGASVTISQRLSIAADTPMSLGIRVKNQISTGTVTITLSNDLDQWQLTIDDATDYDWDELSIQDFQTNLSWLDITIACNDADRFQFTDLRLLYGTNLQGWVQSASEILATNVQFTKLGMKIFDNVHDTETQVTYNEFSTRRRADGAVLFEADDSGVVTNDLKINGETTYNSDGSAVIKQITIPSSSDLGGIAFVKGS